MGDISLDITGEMIHHDEHILYDRLLLGHYGDLHTYIIDVDELHRLCTDDWLHARQLPFHLKLFATATIADNR